MVGDPPEHPVHLAAGERLDGGYPALIDQPVVIAEYRGPRITGVRTASRHLPGTQI